MRLPLYIKSFLNNIRKSISNDLDKKNKKLQLLFCIFFYIFITYIVFYRVTMETLDGILSQVQTFICIFLAFHFGFIGLIILILLNLSSIGVLVMDYYASGNINIITGLVVKIVSIISASIISALVRIKQKQKDLLQIMSETDALTGTYNQRFFHIILEKQIAYSIKNNSFVGLILSDIDNFKMYNDIYGHDFGDKVLQNTSNMLKKIIKSDHFLCRYGGDEFAIIVNGKSIKNIMKEAHDIQNEYLKIRTELNVGNINGQVNLSFGISILPGMANRKDELISQASLALYHTQNKGRDKLHFYQETLTSLKKSITSDHQQLIGIFKALLSTISSKDKYTLEHCQQVSEYAVKIAKALNLSSLETSTIEYAGLLHDIGNIEIPKSILNKNDNLNSKELEIIQEHPKYSINILEPLGDMKDLIDIIKHHHEKYDGSGYPDGLKGDEISLGSRILCVADSYDAMLSDRPYRKGMEKKDAILELEICSGKHFDPQIVKVFKQILHRDKITLKT